jgi:hypothetical protein
VYRVSRTKPIGNSPFHSNDKTYRDNQEFVLDLGGGGIYSKTPATAWAAFTAESRKIFVFGAGGSDSLGLVVRARKD